LEVSNIFSDDYDSRQAINNSGVTRDRSNSNNSSTKGINSMIPRMPDKSQQQVVDSVLMRGTLLPGITKASKFNEEKKPAKKKLKSNKKQLSPYEDDSVVVI
jgi:hypothetical protein